MASVKLLTMLKYLLYPSIYFMPVSIIQGICIFLAGVAEPGSERRDEVLGETPEYCGRRSGTRRVCRRGSRGDPRGGAVL